MAAYGMVPPDQLFSKFLQNFSIVYSYGIIWKNTCWYSDQESVLRRNYNTHTHRVPSYCRNLSMVTNVHIVSWWMTRNAHAKRRSARSMTTIGQLKNCWYISAVVVVLPSSSFYEKDLDKLQEKNGSSNFVDLSDKENDVASKPPLPQLPALCWVDSTKASWMWISPHTTHFLAWHSCLSSSWKLFLKRQVPITFEQNMRVWAWLLKKGRTRPQLVILPENRKLEGCRGLLRMCHSVWQNIRITSTVSTPETHCWILWPAWSFVHNCVHNCKT